MRWVLGLGLAAVVASAACVQILAVEDTRPGWSGGSGGASHASSSHATGSGGVSSSVGTGGKSMVTSTAGTGGMANSSSTGTGGTGGSGGSQAAGTGGGCAGANLLDDPKNCGACGHDCLGAACVGAVCQPITLAINQGGAANIALDAMNVYWTSGAVGSTTAGYVYTVGKNGGVAVQLLTTVSIAEGLAVDTTSVFTTANSQVLAVPKGGGASSPIATVGAIGGSVSIVATDGTNVYVAVPLSGEIEKIALSSNMPTKLFESSSQYPVSVTIDTTNVYWATAGSVMKVPIAGGMAVTLATSQAPTGLAVDAANVYWADEKSNTVTKVPITGGSAVQVASNQSSPGGIAVDATAVYWVNGGGGSGTVMKAPLAGGPPVILASGGQQPFAIAVDDTAVYWTDRGAGTVSKVAK